MWPKIEDGYVLLSATVLTHYFKLVPKPCFAQRMEKKPQAQVR